jgi:dienelactone hydrolase
VALCPATDIGLYAQWCAERTTGVIPEIYQAIVMAYGGTPQEQPERYAAHSALLHSDRLTMPIAISHGDNDAIIPVEESRRLAAAMEAKPNFTYIEHPDGHHDTPLHEFDMAGWLRQHVRA